MSEDSPPYGNAPSGVPTDYDRLLALFTELGVQSDGSGIVRAPWPPEWVDEPAHDLPRGASGDAALWVEDVAFVFERGRFVVRCPNPNSKSSPGSP
jgi:hypothetical protein